VTGALYYGNVVVIFNGYNRAEPHPRLLVRRRRKLCMRIVLTTIAALAFLTTSLASTKSAPAVADSVPGGTTVLLPGGTAIPVHVVGDVSSNKLKAGDTFQVQAAKDVVINGFIVVRSGTLGQGTIGEVGHAGGSGRSGSLTLNFDWIYASDGGKIHLANVTQKQGEDDRKGAASTATIIGFATFGIGGLFGHNLAHGKDVTIDEKKVFNAFVADNIHVSATEKAAREVDHFDH